jgi:hypothetical protein
LSTSTRCFHVESASFRAVVQPARRSPSAARAAISLLIRALNNTEAHRSRKSGDGVPLATSMRSSSAYVRPWRSTSAAARARRDGLAMRARMPRGAPQAARAFVR